MTHTFRGKGKWLKMLWPKYGFYECHLVKNSFLKLALGSNIITKKFFNIINIDFKLILAIGKKEKKHYLPTGIEPATPWVQKLLSYPLYYSIQLSLIHKKSSREIHNLHICR
jgi:hypothetical protein